MHAPLMTALAVALPCSAAPLFAQTLPLYTATDLGRLAGFANATIPRGLNDHGTVVGHASASNGVQRAFVKAEAGEVTALPLPPGASTSSSTIAIDINNAGQIAGFTDAPAQVWVYSLTTAQFTMIPMPPGLAGGEPTAINNLGEVVGWTADTMNLRSFLWSAPTGTIDPTAGLTYAFLTDINDNALIVGSHDGLAKSWNRATSQVKAFPMLPAPYDDTAAIEGVNNLGQGAGWCRWVGSSSLSTVRHAFRSEDSSTTIIELPVMTEASADAGRAINDAGFIVGTTGTTSSSSAYQHAWVLSPQGEGAFLDTLIAGPATWDNLEGSFAKINARGQIVVMGTRLTGLDRSSRGVLLTPVQNCGISDFNGDGDFGTDQDIEAYFACLAGSCCQMCWQNGADFNGDGDVGTDADIEAFFRVLAGGAC
jgi:hypothetical protein